MEKKTFRRYRGRLGCAKVRQASRIGGTVFGFLDKGGFTKTMGKGEGPLKRVGRKGVVGFFFGGGGVGRGDF